MSARTSLLAVAMGAAVVMASCSTVAPDSSPGPTLPPLGTQLPPPAGTEPEGLDPNESAASSTVPSTTVPPTSTTAASTTTTSTTAPTSTEPSTTTVEAPAGGLVDGVGAAIGGRTLSFSSACRDGRAVTLDGVTWAFGGNSFRLSGDDDVRSEAELVGDGWMMPMVVASVQAGVYRYVGTPVDGSVGSAEVTVDHSVLSNC